MHTEEFILIPKRMFASHQPVKKEVLDNPLYKQKAAQLSLLQRNQSNSMEKPERAVEPVETADKMIETAEEEKTEPMSEDSEIEPVVKKQRKSEDFDSILLELDFMNKNQIKRSKIILDLINQSETVTVESNDVLHVNKERLGIKASTFLYNLQQPTKKIDIEKYSKILIALNISPHLVANTHAKQILEASSESEQEFFPSREQPSRQELFSSREQHSGSKPTQKRYKEEPDQTTDEEETSQKMWSFFS